MRKFTPLEAAVPKARLWPSRSGLPLMGFTAQSWKGYFFERFPKASIGIAAMLISFELGISMMSGYFMARFLAGSKTNARGRIPSLRFCFKTYKVHLHHWFIGLSVLVLTLMLHFFVGTPHVFYGFLSGIIVQGVVYYADWPRIVSRA